MKSNFIVCAVWDFIIAAIALLLAVAMPESYWIYAYSAGMAILGVICIQYYNSDIVELNNNKDSVLAIGIISLFLNLITGIVLLITREQIGNQYKKYIQENGEMVESKQPDKKNRKLDNLLKIGAALVTISGVMIATTTWDIMNEILKMVLILVMSIIFFALAKFSESKIKINSTILTYMILAIIFLVIDFILLINYLCFEYNIVLILISILLIAGNIIKSSKYKFMEAMNQICFVLSLILPFIVFFQVLDIENIWISTILILLNTFNVLLISNRKESISAGLIAPPVVLALLLELICKVEFLGDTIYLIIAGVYSLVYIILEITGLIEKNSIFKYTYKVFYNIALLITFATCIQVNNYYALIISIIACVVNGINKDKILSIISIILIIIPANLIIEEWLGYIPVWIYLLIVGLAIISVAVVKELKKSDKE